MRRPFLGPLMRRAALAGAALWAAAGQEVFGQYPAPESQLPPMMQAAPPYPSEPIAPGPVGTPIPTPPDAAAPTPAPTAPAPAAPSFEPAFAPEQFAALGGGGFAIADNAGYIDSAIPRTRFRLRYDSSWGNNRPDRAEFFYPKCGCILLNSPPVTPATFGLASSRSPGPIQALPFRNTNVANGVDPNVMSQELVPYVEYAATRRFSAFAEFPIRFLNPTFVANAEGFSDLNLGFKYALIANPDQFVTFQMRTYVPTGDGDRGLGTAHPTLEPGLLVFQRLGERLFFHGEVRDWIPIRGSDFAGNVLRYGAGLSYNAIQTDTWRLAPVVEFVGWSVLGGKKLEPIPGSMPADAGGDTIANAKIGVRIGLGEYMRAGGGSALNDRHNIYIGYGRALTGDHWYKNMVRFEYQFLF